MAGLRKLPDAVATLDAFDKRVATIRTEVAAAEERLFDQFREELKAIAH